MKPERKHVFPIFLLCCAIACTGFLMTNGVFVGDRQSQTDINFEFGIWTPDTVFGQTFTALHQELCRVDFWLDSYHPWDSPYLELRLFEILSKQPSAELSYEELLQKSREVRHKRMNGWLLSPHMFNSFRFEPIADSLGKRYLLTIQSPEVKSGGSSIVKASSRKRFEHESFFVNGEKKEQDLAFRVMYERSRMALIQEIFARFALEKPFPLSLPGFYAFLFSGYLLLLLLLAWRLWLVVSGKTAKVLDR